MAITYCNPLSGGYTLVITRHSPPSDDAQALHEKNGLRELVAVVDASQSMEGHSSRLVEGIDKLIAAGAEVIVFSDTATRIIPREDGTVDWRSIQRSPSWMRCTSYEAALEELLGLVTGLHMSTLSTRPIVSMLTDGQPNSGDHTAANRRLKALKIDVRTVYFGSLTTSALRNLTDIDCGMPTAIKSTSASLDSHIQSLLALRLEPIVDTVSQSVRIGDLEVRVVKRRGIEEGPSEEKILGSICDSLSSAADAVVATAVPMPEKLDLSTASQLVTCLIAFVQRFGLNYTKVAQDIVRFGSIRLGRHGSSSSKGVAELVAMLAGDTLAGALRQQEALPDSSDRKHTNLRQLCGLAVGNASQAPAESPSGSALTDLYRQCSIALMNNPPRSFSDMRRVTRQAGKVAERILRTADKNTDTALNHVDALMSLPFPRHVLDVSIHPSLRQALSSVQDEKNAASVCAAGNNPWSIIVWPGHIRTQASFSDLTPPDVTSLVMVEPGPFPSTMCTSSLALTMGQINPTSASTQASLAFLTLLLYHGHTLQTSTAALRVLNMVRSSLSALASPPYSSLARSTLVDCIFRYGHYAQQGMSPLAHALELFLSHTEAPRSAVSPIPQDGVLEMALLFLHTLDFGPLCQTHVHVDQRTDKAPATPFSLVARPTRTTLLTALRSQSGKRAVVQALGPIRIEQGVFRDDIISAIAGLLKQSYDSAVERAPPGIWPGRFSPADCARLIELVLALCVHPLHEANSREEVARMSLLLPDAMLSVESVITRHPIAMQAFVQATLLLCVSRYLLGPQQSAPSLRQFFREAKVVVCGSTNGICVDVGCSPMSGPALAVLGTLMTDVFKLEIRSCGFSPDDSARFLEWIPPVLVVEHMREQMAAGALSRGCIGIDACVQFLRHNYSALCPFVADLTAAAASQMNQDVASRFLAAIRLPYAPTETELAGLVVLIAKADEVSVDQFLSTGESHVESVRDTVTSLFTSLPIARHPLRSFRPYLAVTGAEVKRTPDAALALLKYEHDRETAFTTWDAEDIRRLLGFYDDYPSLAQHELLRTLDALDSQGTLPMYQWGHVLHDLGREAYMQRTIEPTADELEVARRRVTAAAAYLPSTMGAQVVTLPPSAILAWMNPRDPHERTSDKAARQCNFDVLAEIMRNLDGLPDATVLDRVITWRRDRGNSLQWQAASKDRLMRNTQILCLMRLAQWDPQRHKWTVPHQLVQRTGAAMPTAALGSLWS